VGPNGVVILITWRRLDHHPQPRPALTDALGNIEDMEPVEADENIAPSAVGGIGARARENTRRRLGHVEAFRVGQLGRYRSLGGLDPSAVNSSRRVAHTHRRYEEPKIRAFIDGWNDRAHPFVWTKTADEILKKANRQQTSETSH